MSKKKTHQINRMKTNTLIIWDHLRRNASQETRSKFGRVSCYNVQLGGLMHMYYISVAHESGLNLPHQAIAKLNMFKFRYNKLRCILNISKYVGITLKKI